MVAGTADDGRSFAVSDPASGGKLAEVPLMTAAETARAIAAAAAACRRGRQDGQGAGGRGCAAGMS
jgi:acyl-CoA reductase-like NAD-dependent aldehyde dehydrogenase